MNKHILSTILVIASREKHDLGMYINRIYSRGEFVLWMNRYKTIHLFIQPIWKS